jgi:hypothetical protein
MRSSTISVVPATIGLTLLGAALYLQTEHAFQAGHFSSSDALAPAITLAVAVSGVLAHHRLASWRLASGLLFLVLSVAGSGVVIYSSLARTAMARDTVAANAMAENRTLELKSAELADAKVLAKQECKVVGDRCRSLQVRADKLIAEMASLRVVAIDPRGDAVVRLGVLVGLDGNWVRQLVGALDPAVAPIACELFAIAMLAAGFPHRRRKAGQVAEFPGNPEGKVVTVSRPWTQADALADLKLLKSVGGQKLLAERWGVSEGCVSKWMAAWASQGEVVRSRDGRKKPARVLLTQA